MVIPLGLMPKFVCVVMKRSYHSQEAAGTGRGEMVLKEKLAR